MELWPGGGIPLNRRFRRWAMTRHRIEQAVVIAFGFLAGAALAICIAPGDALLWAVAGTVLGIFSHAFFIGGFGGELLWPFVGTRHSSDKKADGPRPIAPQH
jgi:hypothetical protein